MRIKDTSREHYHEVLDRALDATKEGKSFLPIFVDMIMDEITQVGVYNYLNNLESKRYKAMKGE